jgi:hypothetical protein
VENAEGGEAMTDLTTTQWRRIAKAATYFPTGRHIALNKLREILGKQRTLEQNKLQMKWHKEAAEQLQNGSAKDQRAFAKLHIGVPILCAEDAEFKAEYDRVIGPLPYETKLALMVEPFDFPVTRLMKKRQKSQYLDDLRLHYQNQGVQLTIPPDVWKAA